MKTSILKTLVLAATMTGAASIASAETVKATIPFAFSANGTAMPAGAYTVRTISGSPAILVFENVATKATAIAFARASVAGSKSSFSIKMATATYELSKETSPLKASPLGSDPRQVNLSRSRGEHRPPCSTLFLLLQTRNSRF